MISALTNEGGRSFNKEKHQITVHFKKGCDGILIRIAEEYDSQAIIDIRKEIILSENTTKFFALSPNEIPSDINKEKDKIRNSNENGNLFIVYEVKGIVVGYLIFTRLVLHRLNHTGSIGMGIKDEYTNQGIGKKLIDYLINWAKTKRDLEKICLCVFSINERAIKVYNRMGFKEEGRRRNQIKYEDGSYADELLMSYYLK